MERMAREKGVRPGVHFRLRCQIAIGEQWSLKYFSPTGSGCPCWLSLEDNCVFQDYGPSMDHCFTEAGAGFVVFSPREASRSDVNNGTLTSADLVRLTLLAE